VTDVPDAASLLEAAEKAVAAGDHATAHRLLRDLAASQEASLGPQHPDLAVTLNNLAFVCEQTNRLEDAERNYRRARAIAVASLRPGHPFIATSLQNLMQFCKAHGIPIFKPPARAAADQAGTRHELSDFESETLAADETPVDDDRPAGDAGLSDAHATGRPPHDSGIRPTVVALATFSVAAVAVVAFLAWRGATGAVESPSEAPSAVGNEAPAPEAPAPETLSPETLASEAPAPDVPAAIGNEAPAPATSAPPPASEPVRETGAAAQVTVLRAQVCSALERTGSPDWQCTPASGDVEPGRYIFYTRVLTDVATTVEHRWYRDDRVHQVVRLDVTPSPGRGYRTFSQTTVGPERAGDWRVELRAADGTLLQEERFAVRP